MSETLLNQKDRSQAFWKFMGMFILSVGFLFFAIFFNFNLPSKENKVLQRELDTYRTQESAQAKFVASMDQAKILIDSLSTSGANVDYLNQQASVKIREMTELQYMDSSFYSALNKNVIDVFLRYQDAANKIVKYGDAPKQLDEIKMKYDQSQRDLENTRRDLDVFRRSMAED